MLYPAELRAPGGPYISPKSRATRGGGGLRPGAWSWLLLLALIAASPAPAAEPPAFDWSQPVELAAIADGPRLTLGDGRTVLTAGILVPEGRQEEARALLERLLAEHRLRLAETRRSLDRYGRLLAQIADPGGGWLQARLVGRGLAVVEPRTAESEVVEALLAIEAEARRARLGVWSRDGGLPAAAERVRSRPLRFVVVEGRARRVGRGRTFLYLNFGEDRRRDFTVRIRVGRLRAFAREGLDPEALAGRELRVRGWIFEAGGPMIEVTDRRQIEVLE